MCDMLLAKVDCLAVKIAKDWLLTGQEQAWPRITWFFGWLSPCRKWPNTQEHGCWLPPSDHIYSWNPFSRPDQTKKRGIIGSASLLYSWHWDLLILEKNPIKWANKRHDSQHPGIGRRSTLNRWHQVFSPFWLLGLFLKLSISAVCRADVEDLADMPQTVDVPRRHPCTSPLETDRHRGWSKRQLGEFFGRRRHHTQLLLILKFLSWQISASWGSLRSD